MGLGDTTRRVVVQFVAEDNNLATTVVGLDGRVRDFKGRIVAADDAMDAFGRSAKLSGAKATTAYGRVSASATSARDSVKGMVNSAKGFASTLKGVGLFGLGLDVIVGAGREAIRVIDELATESLKTQQVTANLQISIEQAAAGFKGYVSNVDLAVAANRAVQFGVVETGEEFGAVARGVQAIAEKTGQSSAKLLDQFVVGVARKSAARLDDLGIILTVTKAEKRWAAELGKTAKELTALEKDEAFQKIALMDIAKAADTAATSVSGFAVTVAQGKIELQNFKSSVLGFDNNLGKVRETLRQLSDEDLTTLGFADFAAEGSGAAKRANAILKEYGVTLDEVQLAARDTGLAFDVLIKGQKAANIDKAAAQAAKKARLENEENVRLMRLQADATEFQANLIAAGGDNQQLANEFTREAVDLRRQAAELAGDETEALKQSRKLALLTAKDSAGRGGGGGGPSRADRVRAAGGAAVQDVEHMATLQAAIAVSAQEIFEAEEASRRSRQAALDLEREALEVTRARGKVARAELATELAAVDQQAGLIVLEGRVAAREREAAAVDELRTLEMSRNAMRSDEAANVVDLETFRLDALAKQLERQGQLAQAAGVRQQLRVAEAEFAAIQFAAREEELALRPPETELERIEQKGALQQLEHDRELARIEQEGAARQAQDSELDRLAKAEVKRKKAAMAQTKAIAGATKTIIGQAQSFASTALNAAGVDGDKRAKIDQKIGAIAAFVQGALATVKGVAAAASSNPVSAAAHFAAAAFAVGTGAALLAGKVQGLGGGGSTAAPAEAPDKRETSEAARIPDSVAAADREPSQRFGADPTGRGGTVININGNITAGGGIDSEFVENLSTELDNLQFSRGA